MRTLVLLLACAQLAACGDKPSPKLAPNAGPGGSAPAPEVEIDVGPPMPAAGTVIEFKTGVRVEVVSAGTGRAARAGRTVVLHQRTFELPPEVAPAPESAAAKSPAGDGSTGSVAGGDGPAADSSVAASSAADEVASDHSAGKNQVAESAVAQEPAADAALAEGAESAPASSAADAGPAVAEAAPAQPVEISSTWRGGVPLTAALGRGQLIEELEQALEGMRAGSRLQVRVPVRGTAPALEIEVELVEVR
ncbi:MAG: FKBP-type peptidyl-prolyl cis-trans isomerase [Planctomycetes bacterium]|nr:FKBP-type peptidyl-prolyl cis-trans isomerase [Planctomycetota bacterium]